MKFIADVNVAQVVIEYLGKSGHDVVDIKKQSPIIADIDIIKIALSVDPALKNFRGLTI